MPHNIPMPPVLLKILGSGNRDLDELRSSCHFVL